MSVSIENELPEGASALIALARVAHRDGNRQLERAAVEKLIRNYGIEVRFPCLDSVSHDLSKAGKGASDAH